MAANLNNTKNKTCELQADKYKNVREFFKYLKIKATFKKTLGKIWFNKQCLINKITGLLGERVRKLSLIHISRM